MAFSETEPPPAEPSGKARRRSAAFIAGFVLLQFLVPLTYLLRDDGADERFTWRTLTVSQATTCETKASRQRVDGERESIELDKLVHRDWLDYVAQNRRAVVNAFLQKQCDAEGVLEVELINRCKDERGVRTYSLRCGGERAHESVRTAAR